VDLRSNDRVFDSRSAHYQVVILGWVTVYGQVNHLDI